MQQLTGVDASFLYFETPNAPKKEPSPSGPPAFDVDGAGSPSTPPPAPPPPSPPAEGRVPVEVPSPSPPAAAAPALPPRLMPIEEGDAAPAPPPPASKPARAAPAAPRVAKAAAPKPAPTKKSAAVAARSRSAKRALRASTATTAGPAATFPGFRLLEGGGSRVFVKIEGRVGVTERRGPGQFVVALPGVSVPSRNDRRPLDTSFFPTPVSQVRLVPREGGADLVIELRQPSEMKLRVEELRDGVVVMIDFPALSGGPSGAVR